jgi:hypothetical protein
VPAAPACSATWHTRACTHAAARRPLLPPGLEHVSLSLQSTCLTPEDAGGEFAACAPLLLGLGLGRAAGAGAGGSAGRAGGGAAADTAGSRDGGAARCTPGGGRAGRTASLRLFHRWAHGPSRVLWGDALPRVLVPWGAGLR